MDKRQIRGGRLLAWVGCALAFASFGLPTIAQTEKAGKTPEMKVDFSYAFGLPHRMTVAPPDSSDKTIFDIYPDRIEMRWTYGNLKSIPLGAFSPLGCNWAANIWPEIDGRHITSRSYSRSEGDLPVLLTNYTDPDGELDMEMVGGSTAAITRITIKNTSDKPHKYDLVFSKSGFGEVPGYIIAGEPTDYMLAGWGDRADRVLVLATGAKTPLRKDTVATTMAQEWELKPGETGSGFLVRPYRANEEDVAKLRSHDWAKEFEQGKQTWRKLLAKAVRFEIPDEGVLNAYYASIGDIFIMREPVANGYIACSPGTEGYRCPNSGEAGMAAVGLDQAGLHKESALGYQVSIDMQGKNGDWNDPEGWSHRAWGMSGFKAWTVMEHYKLTKDRKYLEAVYPRMLACSRWQETQRQRTRVLENGEKPLHYGLMPRGQGDCGLDSGDGWYGYFIPHNAWSIYCDKLTMEAAKILGKDDDAKEVQGIYDRALTDFLAVVEKGAIKEDGYRWIPGSPSNPSGSRWGALNLAVPCGILSPDDDLITGTLKYMNQHLSKGGLQLHTGWMPDGMWVAMSLDNVAEVELARDNGDEAARLIYACLNHGTPLYTWCEERGEDPGTDKTSGDRQHLWTPAAIVRGFRDCMVMEQDDGLHLARGTARQWLGSGKEIGVDKAPTHFGEVSYHMTYDAAGHKVTGKVVFPKESSMQWCVLHIRLPEGLKVKSVDAKSGAALANGGEAIRWEKPAGTVEFGAEIQ